MLFTMVSAVFTIKLRMCASGSARAELGEAARWCQR
jgi:hypothetical protein